MTTMLLKFRINLELYELQTLNRNHGPLFHRWLPDGQQDSIVLDTGHPNSDLEVWFERRGFVDDGWIRFDYKRREVDPEIMSKQGVLDAGAPTDDEGLLG